MPLAVIQGAPVLFAHVPKCAGSAVEDYLERAFGPLALLDRGHTARPPEGRWTRTSPQHADAASLTRLFPPPFLRASFAIVRHPVRRMVSVYYHQKYLEGLISSSTTLDDWLESLRAPGRDPAMYDNHTRPMVEMVPHDARVFRLEDGWHAVIDWLQALAGISVTLPRTMPEINVLSERLASEGKVFCPVEITDAAIGTICSLYRDDFSRFGYPLAPNAESGEGPAAGCPAKVPPPGLPGPGPVADANDVHIIVDQKRINPLRISHDAWQFVVPPNIGSIHLRSRTRCAGQKGNRRVLGLCLRALEAQDSDGRFQIALDHPLLDQGLHEVERDDLRMWRWTDGGAVIPVTLLGDTSKPTTLTIRGLPSSALVSTDG